MDGCLESLEERAKGRKKEADVGSATEDENDSPFVLMGKCCRTAPSIHQLNPLVRVSTGGEICILECISAGFIRLEPLTDPEGDFPMLPCASHYPTQKRKARSYRSHTCDSVISCESEALDELSEGLICASRKAWFKDKCSAGS